MTFTYNQFYKAAQDSGMLGQFSQADLNLAIQNPDAGMTLLSYKQDYKNATTDDQRAIANAGAENVRKTNGSYTAGTTGNGYYKTEGTPSSFSSTENSSAYEDLIKSKIYEVNSDTYSYNPDTDAAAQSYKKMYTREGERATKDALGIASAATGGIASTAAVTAAAQAGQYYGSKLSDKTAELENQAYNRYMQEKNLNLTILDALSGLQSNEYNQNSNDRSFKYGQYMDNLQYNETKTAENKAALEEKAATMADVGDYSLFKELEYTDEQIAQLTAEYKNKKAKSSGGGSYSYNGSTGNAGDNAGNNTGDNTDATQPTSEQMSAALSEIKNYQASGITTQEVQAAVTDDYKNGIISEQVYNAYINALYVYGGQQRRNSNK